MSETCKFMVEGGTWCGLKAVQLTTYPDGKKKHLCKKHKFALSQKSEEKEE